MFSQCQALAYALYMTQAASPIFANEQTSAEGKSSWVAELQLRPLVLQWLLLFLVSLNACYGEKGTKMPLVDEPPLPKQKALLFCVREYEALWLFPSLLCQQICVFRNPGKVKSYNTSERLDLGPIFYRDHLGQSCTPSQGMETVHSQGKPSSTCSFFFGLAWGQISQSPKDSRGLSQPLPGLCQEKMQRNEAELRFGILSSSR